MIHMFNRYFSAKSILVTASEIALISIITFLVSAFNFSYWEADLSLHDPFFARTGFIVLVYSIVLYYSDFFKADYYRPGRKMIIRLLSAVVLAGAALFFICFFLLSDNLKIWYGVLAVNLLVLPVCLIIWRFALLKCPSMEQSNEKVLVIGSGDLAKNIGLKIFNRENHGLRLHGFIDNDPEKLGRSIVNPGVVGGYGDIMRIVKNENIRKIIVALPDRRARLPMSALLDCKLKGVTIVEGATFHERLEGKVPLEHLKPSWVVFSDGFKSLRSRKIVKRMTDVFFSSIMLIVLSPVMLITAILIKLDSKGSVIFSQTRVGENEKEFNVYKFRSMKQDAEAGTGPVWANADDNRVTRFGRFMRKTRLDELPQLINVIKGDMSFVGPRPERPYFVEQLKKEIPYFEMRTVVKPGLTGWTQIKYAYGATVEDAIEKLQYDIYYIKHMSLFFDLMIILGTIKVVLTGQGAR